jgi:hypothetical protein
MFASSCSSGPVPIRPAMTESSALLDIMTGNADAHRHKSGVEVGGVWPRRPVTGLRSPPSEEMSEEVGSERQMSTRDDVARESNDECIPADTIKGEMNTKEARSDKSFILAST